MAKFRALKIQRRPLASISLYNSQEAIQPQNNNDCPFRTLLSPPSRPKRDRAYSQGADDLDLLGISQPRLIGLFGLPIRRHGFNALALTLLSKTVPGAQVGSNRFGVFRVYVRGGDCDLD